MFGRSKFDSLDPPPGALKEGGTEIFRAVIVNKGLQVSLRRGFEDPAMWGLLLADVTRHAARVYARESVMTEAEAVERIRKMYVAEMTNPTDLGTTTPTSN